MNSRAPGTHWILALATGLAVPFVARTVAEVFSGREGYWLYGIAPAVVGIGAWVISTWFVPGNKKALLLYGLTIPLGVIPDVMIDSVDRNLFPFEMAMWVLSAPIPICIGYLLRRKSGLPEVTRA